MIQPGQKFGMLTAILEQSERLRNEIAWLCRCDCGNETIATRGQLLRGVKKSCGCLRKKSPTNMVDMIGRKFGMLTVIERAGKTSRDNALWLCLCDCGNTVAANGTTLRRGEKTSCGCQTKERIEKAKTILLNEKTVDGVQVPLLTKKVRSDSRTGHKGVHRRIRNGKIYYEVSITLKGKRKHVGTFNDLEKAIQARKRAEEEYFVPYIEKYKNKNS